MIAQANGHNRFEFTEKARDVGIQFGYDATESTNRRRAPRSVVQSEDDVANEKSRKKLIATSRDIRRNFSIARWMVNKHLDFVVAHNFKAKTGDAAFDTILETFVKQVSRKKKFDLRQKHPRRRFMRILEACRTLDGDVMGLRVRGGRLQGIEGDRILTPKKLKKGDKKKNWTNGVKTNSQGVATSYAVHKRDGKKFVLEREISAKKIIPFGYYDRFDQERGISPLACAVRDLGDVYEGFDYALAREKVNQFFTLAIYRDAPDGFFDPEGDNVNTEKEPYEVDFSKGPNVLDLDPGDKAEYLKANGTDTSSQSFWETIISIALKSLDLPFSFFKENFTNFFGSRSALMLYLKSVKEKRLDVVEFLDDWLRWRIREGEINGEIQVPVGFDVANVCDAWQWIPDGVPWWNPLQEVKANIDAVNNAQRSRTEIRQEQFGDDWKDVVDKLAEEQAYLKDKGVAIPEATSVPSFEIVTGEQ